MVPKLSVTQVNPSHAVSNSVFRGHKELCRLECFPRTPYTAHSHRLRFKVVGQFPGDGWKRNDIDTNAVKERLISWMSKTQNFVNVTLGKTGHSGKLDTGDAINAQNMEDIFMAEQTVDRKTPNGNLSLAAIVSIEQFSRMNGLTGKKAQKIFKALVPEPVYNNAHNLVEYCCFRFLSRDNSDIHSCLKEPAFQRLIFITMLAWQNPYCEKNESCEIFSYKAFFQGKLVGKEAFVRITPAISGLADRVTVHDLFNALAGDEQGISLSLWLTYIDELIKVHEGRSSYQLREFPQFSTERIICIASSKKRPVLKWKNNMAWPGKLTLTDTALYFEEVGLLGPKDSMRFDLTRYGLRVEKAKVGPLGSDLFDSAISISSGQESETWILEFVDLGGELRRDVWQAFISEVIATHKFIREYGPRESDQSLFHVHGAHKGKERAVLSAINGIARLQALQFMRKLLDDPMKLVQFSYLQNAPYGDVVCQTLAVNFWGGPLVTKFTEVVQPPAEGGRHMDQTYESSSPVFDIDGSVYLQKWMRSPSWTSSASVTFWKNSTTKDGVVLSKNLVVAGLTLLERAARTCKEKSRAVEKTQATIVAAMVKGIPSNIDLFKELVLPLSLIAKNFEKLRHWEDPPMTVSFLICAYTIIFRNMLSYVFPMALMVLAAGMLTLKGLKDQGRLGRYFGRITIRDQPPSNTIQKIIALKDAMRDMENYLQNLNVTLLKIRTIFLSGQPQITTEIALVLLASATILLIVPFKYILAFLLFDVFTRTLELRKEMVMRFNAFLKERWDTIPAAPVIVLPFESDESKATDQRGETAEPAMKKKLDQWQE